MSRRSGQNGSVVIDGKWYRVRWREDVMGQHKRRHRSEKVAPVAYDKHGNPKPPSVEIERKGREIVENSGANSVERFNRVVLGSQTFRERADDWLKEICNRRRNRYKETTTPTMNYALHKHVFPVIGDLMVGQVNNVTCKPLVDAMFGSGLSVTSVNNYMKIVLQIVRSQKDPESGLPVHNLKLNREALDLPKINPEEQNVPAFVAEQVKTAIWESVGDEQMLYLILAAGGLRIGEALGLEVRHVLNGGRTLYVEQAVNRFGEIGGLKTRAAKRCVDVPTGVAAYINEFIKSKSGLLFATANGTPYLVGNLRTRWLQERFPEYGFHSFRRYRVTHLDAVRAHGHLTKVWIGHALAGVTEMYAKSLRENLALRLEESERVGIGFELPVPKCSENLPEVAVAVAA